MITIKINLLILKTSLDTYSKIYNVHKNFKCPHELCFLNYNKIIIYIIYSSNIEMRDFVQIYRKKNINWVCMFIRFNFSDINYL